MTDGPYKIVDGYLVGRGLKIEAAALVEPERQLDPAEGRLIILDAIVDIANGAYRDGRRSVLESHDDRGALFEAAELLEAISKLQGPIAGQRSANAAKVISRLLQNFKELL